MKRLMLVDDEILTRESIRNSIEWHNHGYLYCGDASDGEMALPLIEKWQPQILLTDIKMPFMNGIELATIVRKNYPHIKVIFLSGHDEFHYAQKAIKIGVQDYCLKPIGAKDLLELLNKVSKQIDDEEQKQEILSYTPEKLFADICGGLINTSKAIEIANLLNIPLLNRFYAVLYINFISQYNDEFDNEQLTKAIEDSLFSQFDTPLEVISYNPSRKEQVCVIKSQDEVELQAYISKLKYLVTDSPPTLINYSSVIIGIGNIKTRVQAIHESYIEAIDDKNAQLYAVNTLNNADKFLTPVSLQKPYINRDKLIEFIKIGTNDKLYHFIDSFCEDLEDLSWNSSMYGLYLLNDITLEAFHTAKNSFALEEDCSNHISKLQDMVKSISNIEQAKNYLATLIKLLWQWRNISTNQYSELINKVKLFINENYHSNDLSLQDVSKHIGLSPSHLSKVFSQETKQTLTEYITQLRINKAMELLKTTHFKTFEIAFEVGYQDQHYFSNTFKKLVGVSPMEYRKNGSLDKPISLQRHGESLI